MKAYNQSLNQDFTKIACKLLLSILATVSVHALAAAPTLEQKREFEAYIDPIYQQTAHPFNPNIWRRFHQSNRYVRTGIVAYTVPKKAVGNGGMFFAHGILLGRLVDGNERGQRLMYRFNGDGSYWVLVTPPGKVQPRIISPAEYLRDYAPNTVEFIVETVGGNAIRKWRTEQKGASISWAGRSEPSLQEALQAYNDRVFLNPPAGVALDIEAGDPSLSSISVSIEDGLEFDLIELLNTEAETALRRTMILNKLVQLDPLSASASSYTKILKAVRKKLYNIGPAEVTAIYGELKDELPRGGDYDFPPGCPGY